MNIPPPVQLFASDIDGTLLGDAAAVRRFQVTWESLDHADRPLLVYNTGRSVGETRWLLLEGGLPAPEFIIGGLGTEVHDPIDLHVADEFTAMIATGWDRAKVEAIVGATHGVRPQPAEFQGPFKSSWHWNLASPVQVAQLAVRLEQAGFEVTVNYSADVYLDVVPRRAGKGNALAWLCRRIGVALENVVVAGAGGNNRSMFALPGVRGILPGNASRELLAGATASRPFLSSATYADGVLAGLVRFGVLAAVPAESDSTDTAAAKYG